MYADSNKLKKDRDVLKRNALSFFAEVKMVYYM